MTQTAEHYRVILRPLLTEKSTAEQERTNTYRFEVAPGANKVQIRRAVEGLFEVKVESVRTINRLGKPRRRGAHFFRSAARKIALVTLKQGDKIDLL